MKPATRARKARRFPSNTCPASRHVKMIGEDLAKCKHAAIISAPDHVGASVLATIAALWQARDEIARLKRRSRA